MLESGRMNNALDRSPAAVIALLDGRSSDTLTLTVAGRASAALAAPLTVLATRSLQTRSLDSGRRVIEPWERMEAAERALAASIQDAAARLEIVPHRIEVRFGNRHDIALDASRRTDGALLITARASLQQGSRLSDRLLQRRLGASLLFADDPDRIIPGSPWPDTRGVLGRHPLFRGVRPREIKVAASNLDIVRVGAEATLIREGQRNGTFWLLLEGSAAVSIRSITRRTVASGDFVGAYSLLTGQPAPATVVTLSPVRALVASRSQFDGVLGSELVRLRVQAAYAERFGADLLALGGGAAA